jgi:hypothetical protein
MLPDADLAARIERLTGRRPVAWDAAPTGGYTQAIRRVVRFADGGTAFVKAANDDQTAIWLRAEIDVYRELRAPFMPAVLAADDDYPPLLVLEDLRSGHWPPPWRPGDVERVRDALDAVHSTAPPEWLVDMVELATELNGWWRVASEPIPFLTLGLCSADWLATSLPTLVEAEAAAVLAGNDLCHTDVRSDNLCLLPDRVVFVDWNFASRGNGDIDLLGWLPSLAAEGGPSPEAVAPTAEPTLVAMLAGYWAWRAPQPPPSPGSRVRLIQRRQLEVILPWAARRLGLPPPA